MKYRIFLSSVAVAASLAGSVAFSDANQSEASLKAAVTARQSQMKLYAFNIGLLGGMAKGEIEYDAAAASAAAGNLAALTRTNQSRMWPMGSDNGALGDATRALPAIWQEGSTTMAKGMAFGEAAAAMEAAAGQGLDELRAAIGPLGGACTACHKEYRQPEN